MVLLPLLTGAGIYRFLRSKRPAILGDGPVVELPLPTLLLQSSPSLLWSFALCSALLLIWRPSAKWAVWAIVGGAVGVSLLFEVWQAADFGIGTFDWKDCLFSVAGCLLSLLIFQKFKFHEDHD